MMPTDSIPNSSSEGRYVPSRLEMILAGLCLAAVLFVSLNRYTQWGFSARPWLLFASTLFVAIPFCTHAVRSGYGISVSLALVFCWLGDYAGPYSFMIGVGFFLIGHGFLILGYVLHGLKMARLAFAAPIGLGISVWIGLQLLPLVHSHEQWLVIAYLVTITLMVSLAGGAQGRWTHRLLVLGAVLFYVSDLFLALNRYTAIQIDYTYFGYPMYYAACVLFGLSVSATELERAETLNQPLSNDTCSP